MASVIFLSIAYDARAEVGKARDNNIIKFSDGIYTRLGQWHHLKDSDYFPKEHFATLRIVKSCKLVPMENAPIFAYLFQITCLSNFVLFTLLTRFSNLW